MAKTLIVDDSVFTRSMLKNFLTALGHDTIGEAADVAPALKAYGDLKPELITLDIVLPSGTGVDILKKIREKDKATKVIVVTASAKSGLDAEVLRLGANAVLHKPFTAEEFRLKLLTISSLDQGAAPAPRAAASATLAKEEIVAAAIEHSKGLSDWGEDQSFWEPFDKLLMAAKNDGAVRAKDAVGVAYTLGSLLVNRLMVQQYVKLHPEVRDVPVRRPLIILGLPMMGDMVLHRLLAQSPAARSFQLYELLIPCFPTSASSGEDLRIRIAKEYFDLEMLVDESMRRFHAKIPLKADLPDQTL